jgi:transcriptional regulator with XRE-family HTH domain
MCHIIYIMFRIVSILQIMLSPCYTLIIGGMVVFGDRLKDLRTDSDLTQDELSKILGITRSALSNYENNEREPDFKLLVKFANYFNVSLDFILCRTNIKTPQFVLSEVKSNEQAKLFDELLTIIRNNMDKIEFITSLLKLLKFHKKL